MPTSSTRTPRAIRSRSRRCSHGGVEWVMTYGSRLRAAQGSSFIKGSWLMVAHGSAPRKLEPPYLKPRATYPEPCALSPFMNWLFKEEPTLYSYDGLARD